MRHFDHNATTPLLPEAREAWLRASDLHWHNPSGPGRASAAARLLLEACRERMAGPLGVAPGNLAFTSGGTEVANAALAWLAGRARADGRVLLSPFEHPCVHQAALRWFPGRVDFLPASADGVCRPDGLPAMLRQRNIAAVALMAVHNETGVVQPWGLAAESCRAAGVPFLCDAGQWFGKLPPAGIASGGLCFGSAHKFNGGKGMGFAVWSGAWEGLCLAEGGGQEGGRRSGTPDVPGAAALAEAFLRHAADCPKQTGEGRDAFEARLRSGLPGPVFLGAGAPRLWNTSFLLLPEGSDNLRWVLRLDKKGFAVGTGAACSSLGGGASRTLAALGLEASATRRTLRFSSGWETSAADWLALAEACLEVAAELSAEASTIS